MNKNDAYEMKIWQKNYPDFLPAEIEVKYKSGLEMFEKSAAEKPDYPAFYYFDEVITYGEVDSKASSLAVLLQELGIEKGDRVIVQLQNIPQYLVSLYGIWKVGAIAVPLNPMYKENELEFYCNDSEAKIIITMESCFEEVKNLVGKTPLQYIITTSELDYIKSDVLPGVLEKSQKINISESFDLEELTQKNKGSSFNSEEITSDDVGLLTYTSGTTGPPKGAMNTHGNIVFSSYVYYYACQFSSEDVVVGAAPFFHVTGGIGHVSVAALAGVPTIGFFRFEPGEVLRLIEKWHGSMMIAPLTAYIAMMSHSDFENRDLSSLNKVLSGGAAVPDNFVQKFYKESGAYIHNWYGLTESTSPCIITPLGCESPVDSESGALSIGVPVPNTIVKIVDVETKEVLPVGETGEIVARGPTIVPGYWNKPEENKEAFEDGFHYTGDVGKMDEDGWFYYVDRKKDLINVSGYKVWPREVEDILFEHESVKEACVIGVADSYRGETVKAFVTLKEGYEDKVYANDLVEFCKERMAAYKYPRLVEIIDELPKTGSGKILKKELKAREKQS